MLRAADWASVAARNRENDWSGPAISSLAAVLTLLGRPPG